MAYLLKFDSNYQSLPRNILMLIGKSGNLLEEVLDYRVCLDFVDEVEVLTGDERLVKYTQIIIQLLLSFT